MISLKHDEEKYLLHEIDYSMRENYSHYTLKRTQKLTLSSILILPCTEKIWFGIFAAFVKLVLVYWTINFVSSQSFFYVKNCENHPLTIYDKTYNISTHQTTEKHLGSRRFYG